MGNRLLIEDKLDTMNENLEKMADGMRKISLAIGGEVEKPSTWEEIRILCRNNNIRGLLEVGDVVPFTKDGVRYDAVVMDFIEDGKHSEGLKLKDGLQTGVIFQVEKLMYLLQFDEREAFYCAVDGLSAGTYSFVLREHSWFAADVGKTFQFTLPSDVPKGAQFVFVQAYNATLSNAKVNVFADGNSRTSLEQVTLTEGSSGTALGELKNALNGNFNSCQRAFFGSNNWKNSALRQHLNSEAIAGEVWKPQTKWDRPPSWFTTTKGFLNGLEEDLKKHVAKVDRHTYRNTVCDGGGIDETEETIFLMSRKEVFMPVEGADDTEPMEYYKAGSVYETPNTGADPVRIKTRMDTGAPYYWWLQSPYVGIASIERVVTSTGAYDNSNAYYSNGVAPAFVIA